MNDTLGLPAKWFFEDELLGRIQWLKFTRIVYVLRWIFHQHGRGPSRFEHKNQQELLKLTFWFPRASTQFLPLNRSSQLVDQCCSWRLKVVGSNDLYLQSQLAIGSWKCHRSHHQHQSSTWPPLPTQLLDYLRLLLSYISIILGELTLGGPRLLIGDSIIEFIQVIGVLAPELLSILHFF